MLEVRLLGQFDVRRDGAAIAIPSRAAQSFLAYLLLTSGTIHRREKLAGLFWPDTSDENARKNLRHELWRLRQAIEIKSPRKKIIPYLLIDEISIGFNAATDYWLDLSTVQTPLAKQISADQLIETLSLYRGELLPGMYDDWVVLERERVRAVFEQKMARLLELLIEEKRGQDILDWGERWISFGQTPEPAYRALMLAYNAKGDQSKMAATFQRCVDTLKNDLGVEPSAETQALFDQLSKSEHRVSLPTISREPVSPVHPTNLPVPLTSFIGREREIEQVKHLLVTTRLLTLTGTGGIGKTRLAIHVAKDLVQFYKDGVWWVELAPVIDSKLVPQSVAQVLGVRESAGQPLTESLKKFLREKQLLLILDNCEHVIAACAQLAEGLLTQCANLSILATSREALGITGETTVQVPALSFPVLANLSQLGDLKEFESIQLFAERAAAVHPDLALTQEHAFAVTQICHRLDGIPLAIELAAARMKVFTLSEIAARLNDRFALLTQGSRTALPRHQTLRALIGWSYDLLSESEGVLWRRLSVFIGGWTLEAAESVGADDNLSQEQIFELLSHLVDKSLVIVEEQNGLARYRMLETLRQYAQEKLQSTGEKIELCKRHFEFFLKLADNATSRLLTAEQKKWFAKLDAEYSNLRSALEWGMENDTVSALRLAGMLGQYWEVRGYIAEGRNAIERTLELAQNAPKHVRAIGLQWLAKFAARQGDYVRANELLEESFQLWRELGDKRGIAHALHNSGMVFSLQGDYTAAKISYEESLTLSKEIGNKREIASLITSLGNVANYIGDYETARRYQEESVKVFRELGDKFGLFIALNNLGIVFEAQGDNSAAQRYYEESIATAYELGEKNLIAYALNGLAHVLYLKNDSAAAKRNYRESLIVAQEIGERRCIAYCLEGFAKIASRYGNANHAAHWLGAAESLRQVISAPLIQVERDELEHDMIATRNLLGEKNFEARFAAGRAMSMEQAIKLALEAD